MKKRRFESAALAVIATSFAFVPGLRAQQTGPGPGANPADSPAAQPSAIPDALQERLDRIRAAQAAMAAQPEPKSATSAFGKPQPNQITAASPAAISGTASQAPQSEQDTISLLTTGTWRFHGKRIARHFKEDGTFTSSNGSKGSWTIKGDKLDISFGNDTHVFDLPLNPTVTHGRYRGAADTLTRDPLEAKAASTASTVPVIACTLVEADAVSVSASMGKTGDVDLTKSYKITDSTKVTIDGQPARSDYLKGGMTARIQLATDGVTALSIDAKDPGKR